MDGDPAHTGHHTNRFADAVDRALEFAVVPSFTRIGAKTGEVCRRLRVKNLSGKVGYLVADTGDLDVVRRVATS